MGVLRGVKTDNACALLVEEPAGFANLEEVFAPHDSQTLYLIINLCVCVKGFPGGKEPTCQCRRHKIPGFHPWVRKIPRRKACQSTPIFLPGESHLDRGAWWATVPSVTKSQTQLKWLSTHMCENWSVVSSSSRSHGLKPAGFLCLWGFSRQEYWNWLPCPPPGDLPDPGIEPRSPALQADSLPPEPPGKPNNLPI